MTLNLGQVNNINKLQNRSLLKERNAVTFSSLNKNVDNITNSHNSDVSFTGGSRALRSIVDKLTKSSVSFSNFEDKKVVLNELFGNEIAKMEKELQEGWGASVYAHRVMQNRNGSVTFVEDGILPKFFKSAIYPVKDLWLDLANWALGGISKFEKFPKLSEFAKKGLDADILKKRADSKRLEDVFCIIEGAFSDLARGEEPSPDLQKAIKTVVEKNAKKTGKEKIDGAKTILENMLHSTGSVKGNYKTADERTINRICTGLVSSTMAGIDFYNISRMQNDNDELARKSQNKRFRQESSRIMMSAGMTFLTLGALSKYANANKYVALATISGTTLVSEVLSRLLSGMPLHPLTPDEAKIFAKNQHDKKAQKEAKLNGVDPASQIAKSQSAAILQNAPDVFSQFAPNKDENTSNEQEFKGSSENKEEEKAKNSSPLNLHNFLKAVGGLFAAGMVVCFARSRNEKFNSLLKDARKGLDDAYNMITKKDYSVPAQKINAMIDKIDSEYKLHSYAEKFREALADDSAYKRFVQKVDGKDVEYIKLGSVDKKFVAPFVKAVTYPFAFLWGAIRFPVKTVRGLFEKEAKKDGCKVKPEDIMGLYKTFDKALDKVKAGKMSNEELERFIKRKTIIGIEDKTGKSTYKNSSLAAISRPIVTLIASYFFVNDYRNEVLITSNGKDVEGANTVAKERVMHKVSNFFFNAMFMNLFNSVFETAYHGSLIGAGAVAAATEFTNENVIRKSIGVPTRKMTKAQIEEHDRQNLTRDDFWGKYFRFMSKLTGKKTISQKAQDEEKKKAKKA